MTYNRHRFDEDAPLPGELYTPEELEEMENTILGKLFQLQDLQNTHPVPIQRCVEIDKWSKSEQYQRILSGAYAQVNG